jgi:hypothetical protein
MVFGKQKTEGLAPKDQFDILDTNYRQAIDRGNVEEITWWEEQIKVLVEETPDLRSDPAFDHYR